MTEPIAPDGPTSLRDVRELVRQATHINKTGEPASAPASATYAAESDEDWAARTILRIVALAVQLDQEAIKARAVGNDYDAVEITAESDRLYDALDDEDVPDPA